MPSSSHIPILETERLLLRPFSDGDITAWYAIYSDEEANTFLPWYPVKSLEEADGLFREELAAASKDSAGYRYAVCLKADNIPIGYIVVSSGESHDFGYGLRKEFWHQGITTEASSAVVELLRKDGVPFITATHDVNNPRSGNVMKNIGMIYCYSYEELWQPKNIVVTFRMYQLNLDGQNDRVYQKYWETCNIHFIEKEI